MLTIDVLCTSHGFKESVYGGQSEQEVFVHTVLNGIAIDIVRLHSFGIRNIVVLNLPLLVCIPLSTLEVGLDFRACSTNTTFVNEISLHNSLLQERVRMLNQQLKGLHVVIADQTKAMQQLFYHGPDYGSGDSIQFEFFSKLVSSKKTTG